MEEVVDSHAIDAVITWVDGDDPDHIEKRNRYLPKRAKRTSGELETRFRQSGELEYCVTSLLRFAPWLNKIYIVTDNQTPHWFHWLQENANVDLKERIEIVDHSIVFRDHEDVLPTFNCRSIESVLWRIPGLSERFINLNDDFALIRSLEPSHFFHEDKLVLAGRWRSVFPDLKPHQKLANLFRIPLGLAPRKRHNDPLDHTLYQERTAYKAGYDDRFFQLPHIPHPLFRSTFERQFEANARLLRDNIEHRFRHPDQYWAISYATLHDLRAGRAIVDNALGHIQLKPGQKSHKRLVRQLTMLDESDHHAFICMQGVDLAPDQTRQLLLSWLDRRIGTLKSFVESEVTKAPCHEQ